MRRRIFYNHQGLCSALNGGTRVRRHCRARVRPVCSRKTTRRRRDAPLDAESSRVSPSHASRNNPTVREDWLSLSRGEKKWQCPGERHPPFRSTPFAFGVLSCGVETPPYPTSCPLGSVPRVRREGNQSGKKLNITPRRMWVACWLYATLAKFSSFWLDSIVFGLATVFSLTSLPKVDKLRRWKLWGKQTLTEFPIAVPFRILLNIFLCK